MSREKDKRKREKEAPQFTGEMGKFYICGGRPGMRVRMPDRVKAITDAREMYNNDIAAFRAKYPRCTVVDPTLALVATKQSKKEALAKGKIALANGDFIIDADDPELALECWLRVSRVNPNAYIHPCSLPIPGVDEYEHRERLTRRQKRDLSMRKASGY
jgi:hypothetical protein